MTDPSLFIFILARKLKPHAIRDGGSDDTRATYSNEEKMLTTMTQIRGTPVSCIYSLGPICAVFYELDSRLLYATSAQLSAYLCARSVMNNSNHVDRSSDAIRQRIYAAFVRFKALSLSLAH